MLEPSVSAILAVLILNSLLSETYSVTLKFEVQEESQLRTTIGRISSKDLDRLGSKLTYRLLDDRYSAFFQITEDGSIQVNSKIDLETLCRKRKLCCGTTKCAMKFRVIVSNGNGEVAPIEVEIGIKDVNDNQPQFEETFQKVRVQEGASIGTRIGLKRATDADKAPENQIQRYRFREPSGKFTLIDDRRGVALLVKGKLDYETKTEYQGRLEACDRENCAKQTVTIEVVDENDNSPRFEKKVYNASIKESFLIDDIVLKLQAIDLDSGQYGRVEYMYQSVGDQDLENTFEIRLDSGEIRLRQKLSAKSRNSYKFQVAAVDVSNPDSGKDTAEVNIAVEDINDYQPVISVMFPAEPISIAENVPPKKVATISVTDEDLGDNSIVDCSLSQFSEKAFSLESNSAGVYHLKTTREFDYEQEVSATATMICKDHGTPAQTSTRPIPVSILDINEFSPEFELPVYRKNVSEDSQAGVPVLQLRAIDKDGSANLTYSLDSDGLQYFNVNPTNGWLTTNSNPLNREEVDRVTFTAIVKDSKQNPRSAKTSIVIFVDDVNDNAPVFTSQSQFELTERSPPYTQLPGQLSATDADTGENSQVRFDLMRVWGIGSAGKQIVNGYFRVTEAGVIEAIREIDREVYSEFILQVAAHDRGIKPLSTMTNISVIINDVNDNTPEWTYPKDQDSTINITSAMNVGDLVWIVRARDLDTGANGRLIFRLLSETSAAGGTISPAPAGIETSGRQPLFSLNATTGEILLSQSPQPGQYRLRLRVSDDGPTKNRAETWLIINVNGAGGMKQLNLTIIIVMIAVTAVISIFLIVAIVCVRRRPPRYASPPGSDLTKDQLPPWAYQLEDQSAMGVMGGPAGSIMGGATGDAASGIFMPGLGEDQNLQAMHTFGGNRCCGDMRLHYELDGDSADSGRGGSEDEPGLHHAHHLHGNDPAKGWPFSPVQFHNRPPSRTSLRARVASPVPGSNPCQCYILPEDGVIQAGQSPYPHPSTTGSGMPPPPAYDTHSLPRGVPQRRPFPSDSGGMTLGRLHMDNYSGAGTGRGRLPPFFHQNGALGEEEEVGPLLPPAVSIATNASSSIAMNVGRGSPEPLPAPPAASLTTALTTTSTFTPIVVTTGFGGENGGTTTFSKGAPTTTANPNNIEPNPTSSLSRFPRS